MRIEPVDEVVVLDTLLGLRAAYRRSGRTVVWTNGCFDLLHAGHVRSLRAAAALGDVLVVGVNSDESVRRLEGPSRPVLPEADRAELLAALGCVDHVLVLPDSTPAPVLGRLRPDVHCKGADYAPPHGPDGVVRDAVTYDAAGDVLTETDARGRTTSFGYDLVGDRIWAVDPRGLATAEIYDSAGDAVGTLDAGGLTQTAYDGDGRPVATYGPGLKDSFTTYDAAGNVSGTTDAMGRTTLTVYDADNRPVAARDGNGAWSNSTYDAAGNLFTSTDARGFVSRYVYNADGERIQSTDGAGVWSQTVVDALGLTRATIDAKGTTRSWYDGVGELVKRVDPRGAVSTWAFDGAGNQTSSTDSNGNIVR